MTQDGHESKNRSGRDDRGLFRDDKGVFMISVAAELSGMHPQTLRLYESRGLIKPKRSPKKTRLYSQRDVERLKRIQALTTELGMNLAGVEQVLKMEEAMEEMAERMRALEQQADELQQQMLEEIDAVHRSYKRELVRWERPGDVLRAKDAKPLRVPINFKRSPSASPSADLTADGESEPEAAAGGGDAAR
jgi:MerR family transcriptional regulator/heat shock protein HspR